jgi:hypothetical protein
MKGHLYLLSGALALGVLGTGLAALGQTSHAAKNPASKAGATARQGRKPWSR